VSNLITIQNLTVKYESFTALKAVDFSLSKGEFVAILGQNGSGKTTLIQTLLGLKEPTSGTITLQEGLRMGYLPQHYHNSDKNFPATVEEVVLSGALLGQKGYKRPKSTHRFFMEKHLEELEISHLKHRRIGTLSGGQQQRALLARALMTEPDVLIMDEPTSALDPSMRDTFFELLTHLNHHHHVAILLITHDIGVASEYLKRVIYLDQKVLFDGTFEAFCENDELSPYVHTHLPHKEGK
jgi:zinc transport system ATP-binding protein